MGAMKNYTWLFFDLDGTLTDSAPGITRAVSESLRRFGAAVPEEQILRRFIGPPLMESYQRYIGLSEAEAQQCICLYREYYADQGLFENAVYPGIPELLERLQRAGKRLAITTGKPEAYAVRIAGRFGLSGYFSRIAGSGLDGTRTSKAEVIRYAMDAMDICSGDTVLMIGDREHDVLGARRCGVDCLGVLYGYGSREELEAAGALALAERVEDIGRLVLDGTI